MVVGVGRHACGYRAVFPGVSNILVEVAVAHTTSAEPAGRTPVGAYLTRVCAEISKNWTLEYSLHTRHCFICALLVAEAIQSIGRADRKFYALVCVIACERVAPPSIIRCNTCRRYGPLRTEHVGPKALQCKWLIEIACHARVNAVEMLHIHPTSISHQCCLIWASGLTSKSCGTWSHIHVVGRVAKILIKSTRAVASIKVERAS